MYYLLILSPPDEEMQPGKLLAVDAEVCLTLARERDSPRSIPPLSFRISSRYLHEDYLYIYNVPTGMLCSQRFLNVLSNEDVPFTAYPTQLLEWDTQQPLDAPYSFWIAPWIKGAIDWERSEEWVDHETGNRHRTKLALTSECIARAPLLFQAMETGQCLVHEKLRTVLETTHLTGFAFAPLDSVFMPYEGLRRVELERLLQKRPEDWERWCQLSTTFVLAHRYGDALEPLNRALALKPDLEQAWEKRGHILFTLGHLQEALEALKRAIELEPQSQAWYEYSAVLRALGRQEEALASAQHLVELWGMVPLTWYELAAAHAASGHQDKALQAIERCLGLGAWGGGTEQAKIARLKGELLVRLGRYEEALATYEMGLEWSSIDKVLRVGKIKTLRLLGRNKEAEIAEAQLQRLEQRREENVKKRPM
jgi:tetratricopeptide (TPR) repeat protein